MARRLNRHNAVIIEGEEHRAVLNDGFSKCDECSLNHLCDEYSSDEYSGSVPCAVFKDVLGDIYFRRKGDE